MQTTLLPHRVNKNPRFGLGVAAKVALYGAKVPLYGAKVALYGAKVPLYGTEVPPMPAQDIIRALFSCPCEFFSRRFIIQK